MPFVVQSGAAGEGVIASTAGPLLVLVLIVTLFAVPAVREALATWVGALREHLVGPADDTNAAPGQPGAGTEDEGPHAGRASDRDSYDFDLDVLNEGDSC